MKKKTFEIRFHGRRKGALGIGQIFQAERTAYTAQEAELALYDDYEHISGVQIIEKGTKK